MRSFSFTSDSEFFLVCGFISLLPRLCCTPSLADAHICSQLDTYYYPQISFQMSPQRSSGSLYLSSSFSAGKTCLKPLSPDLYGLHNAYCTCLLFECALLGYMFWEKKKEDIKFIFMSLTPSSDSGTSTLINNIS